MFAGGDEIGRAKNSQRPPSTMKLQGSHRASLCGVLGQDHDLWKGLNLFHLITSNFKLCYDIYSSSRFHSLSVVVTITYLGLITTDPFADPRMASTSITQTPAKYVGPDYRPAEDKPTATVSIRVEHPNVHILPQTPQLIALLT